MPKTIKEQILERSYKRQVERVKERFNIPATALDKISSHPETIQRLHKLPADLDEIQDATVNTISIYVNGIFVYEENPQTGWFINALPQYYKKFDTLEICLNDNLMVVAIPDRVVINFLKAEKHPRLAEGLRRSMAWKELSQAAF